jgi:hypothetical protein
MEASATFSRPIDPAFVPPNSLLDLVLSRDSWVETENTFYINFDVQLSHIIEEGLQIRRSFLESLGTMLRNSQVKDPSLHSLNALIDNVRSSGPNFNLNPH